MRKDVGEAGPAHFCALMLLAERLRRDALSLHDR